MHLSTDAGSLCIKAKRFREDSAMLRAGLERWTSMGMGRYASSSRPDSRAQLMNICSCCIDKTSTAELSEAINSMFLWYRKATTCYAYLSDVRELTELAQSRWFTRGWTLQELLAPAVVRFYSEHWNFLGSKLELRRQLQKVTGILQEVLIGGELNAISVARRMSWAANRQTTRTEDLAYCMMGIFDINMPLLYGEGKRSFIRLQEEIMKISDDHSLFAWGLPHKVMDIRDYLHTFKPPKNEQLHALFADSPSDFTFADRIHVLEDRQSRFPPIVSNSGVRIELQVKHLEDVAVQFAVIYCTVKEKYKSYLGFPIVPWGGKWVARCGELLTIAVSDLVPSDAVNPYRETSILLIKAPVTIPKILEYNNLIRFTQIATSIPKPYNLKEVHCSAHASYSWDDQTITMAENKATMHVIFFFAPKVETNPGVLPVIDGEVDPAFAVLVGGDLEEPWVESVMLVSDNDALPNFYEMDNKNGWLAQCCTTKAHLLSLLEQGKPLDPLFRGLHRQEKHTIVRQSRSPFGPKVRTLGIINRYTYLKPSKTNLWYTVGKGMRDMLVTSQLRMVSTNLVERSHYLFVEVDKRNFHPIKQAGTTPMPSWWKIEKPLHATDSNIVVHGAQRSIPTGSRPFLSDNSSQSNWYAQTAAGAFFNEESGDLI
jgi:hypothetical protein